MHLIGNMWFLWIFGHAVEDRMGHLPYLIFYLLCGVAAAMAQVLMNSDSSLPMIGASGAIAGVLGAYLILYPRARVVALVPMGFFLQTAALPAIVFLGLWFAFQFISGMASLAGPGGGSVAFFAHVGGFVAGMILVWIFARRPSSVATRPDWSNLE